MDKENNFKKLLCYNIVNNNDCIYKNKCMFAHELKEQKKDILRDYIYKIILVYDDLCNINIFEKSGNKKVDSDEEIEVDSDLD